MEKLEGIFFYTLEKSIKTYRKFAQQMINNAGYDITIDQWLILKTLQERERIPQNQVAELVFKDVASVTRIIEILVQKKYVRRRLHKTDRRKFELEITEMGISIIKNIYPIVIAYRNQALKSISDLELKKVKNQLEKIINNCQ